MFFDVKFGAGRSCIPWSSDDALSQTLIWPMAAAKPGMLVVGGASGSTAYIEYSTDQGATWNSADTSAISGNALSGCMIWNGSGFVTFNNGGDASGAISSDGITWTAIVKPNGAANYNQLAVAGSGRIIYPTFFGGPVCYYSDNDGASWGTLSNYPSAQTSTTTVGANEHGVIIVMKGYPGAASDVYSYSTDNGANWTTGTLPLSQIWRCITWNGQLFSAFAQNSGTWIRSPDGVNWTTKSNLPAGHNWHKAAGTRRGHFMLSGLGTDDRVVCSADDGESWSYSALNYPGGVTSFAIQMIACNEEQFVAGRGSVTGATPVVSYSDVF